MICSNNNLITCLLLSLFLFSSCSIEKRRYNPGFHVEWFSSNGTKKTPDTNKKTVFTHFVTQKVDSLLACVSKHSDSSHSLISSYGTLELQKEHLEDNLFLSQGADSNKCDLMILKNGEELNVKVTEIGEELVRYKMCNNLDGPIFTKRVSEIFMIKYPNGTKTVLKSVTESEPSTISPNSNSHKPSDRRREASTTPEAKTIPFATAFGFISGLVGLLVFPFIFGLMAIIFGAIGYSKTVSEPDKYKGKTMAIWAIVLGTVVILAAVILLGLL